MDVGPTSAAQRKVKYETRKLLVAVALSLPGLDATEIPESEVR